jgi:MFS transporter, DHA1 family, inner membrane transport protein
MSTQQAVVTGLILAVLAVPVAWATSLLRPPVLEAGSGHHLATAGA